MSSTRERRILKELQDIQLDKDNSGVFAQPVDPANLLHLKGTFPGPLETPYAGGTFQVDILIPDSYPFKSPNMRFDTKIWHPNVSSQTGAICLDTLSTGWSPVGTIKMALMSLRMLLEAPNPSDPQDAEVANMMTRDPKKWAQRAHDWAVKFAGATRCAIPPGRWSCEDPPPAKEEAPDDPSRYKGYNKDLVDRFVAMGFSVDTVVSAMLFVGIDKNGGEDYELEEAYMGDITARLLGEN